MGFKCTGVGSSQQRGLGGNRAVEETPPGHQQRLPSPAQPSAIPALSCAQPQAGSSPTWVFPHHPQLFPPLTTVSRCPADGFHGVLFIHDLGEPEVTLEGQRGEQRCRQGEGLSTPPPATTPRPPGKPTDFKGSVGGQVCVEQVLWLQVTVDDSIFVQILQRERESGDGGKEGKGQGKPHLPWTEFGRRQQRSGTQHKHGPNLPTSPLETPNTCGARAVGTAVGAW